MAKSPVAIPFSTDGVEIGVTDALAVPANQRGFIAVGYDGANLRFLRSNSSGQQIIVGAGVAGTPAGGVLSVQGVSGGQELPVSVGSLPLPTGAATEATLATRAAATQFPAALVGGRLDVVVGSALPAGTNNIGDVDVLTVPAPLSTTGGGVEATALRVTLASDSTGLVSVDDNGGSLTVDTPQLPAALVGGRLDANVGAWFGSTAPTIDQKVLASSIPVALASEQSATDGVVLPGGQQGFVGVGFDGSNLRFLRTNASGQQIVVGAGSAGTPSGGVITVQGVVGGQALPVSVASLPLPTGAATESTLVAIKDTDGVKKITDPLPAGTNEIGKVAQGTPAAATVPWAVRASDGSAFINVALEHVTAASPHATRLSDGSAFYDATKTGQLPAALVGGRLDVVVGAALPAGTNNIGDVDVLSLPAPLSVTGGGTEAVALRVTLASDSTGLISVDDDGGSLTTDTPQLPGALIGGRLDSNVGAWLGSTAPTVGQKTMVASVPIVVASDQSKVPVHGAEVHGAPLVGNPVLVGGSDGTNAYRLLTDATGRLQVIATTGSVGQVEGRAADGVTPVGNPVLVAGQDGTNVQTIKTDTTGRVEVVPSGSTATVKGFSNGEVVLASTTVTAVRSTTYTEPSAGAQRSVSSANANDTSAGTGARTLRITYYTLSAGTVAGPFTEDVTLNGTTAVNTVATNICYIERLQVLTIGSGGVNAGIITLFGAAGGGGGTVWTIAAGANRTFGAHHYVPSGVTANITSFIGGIKGADTSGFILRVKDPTNANSAEIQISDLLRAPSSGSSPLRAYGTPIEVLGPARITAFALPDSSSSRTYYASFDYYEQ